MAARTCAGRSLFWGNTSDIQVLWEVLRLRVHQLWPGSAEYEEGPRAVLTNTVCAAAVAVMLGVLGVCWVCHIVIIIIRVGGVGVLLTV